MPAGRIALLAGAIAGLNVALFGLGASAEEAPVASTESEAFGLECGSGEDVTAGYLEWTAGSVGASSPEAAVEEFLALAVAPDLTVPASDFQEEPGSAARRSADAAEADPPELEVAHNGETVATAHPIDVGNGYALDFFAACEDVVAGAAKK